MSVYRSITRIAAVSAVNNLMQEPWPTLAKGNVFDSKIEPVEDMKADQVFPTCVIYTDYDKDYWSKGKMAIGSRNLNLTIELLVVQAEEVDNSGVFNVDCPETDSEIETTLDLLEDQVFRALRNGSVAADCFNYICVDCVGVVSRRGASFESGQRLAARQITLEMAAMMDPEAGVVPAQVAAFLDQLEESSPDYRDRVPFLREALTMPSGRSDGWRVMQATGLPSHTVGILGQPVETTVLGPNINYHLSGLAP